MEHVFFPVTPPLAVIVPLALALVVPATGGIIALRWRGLRARSLVTTLVARSAIVGGALFALIATVATLSVLRTGLAELHNRHLRDVVGLTQGLGEVATNDALPVTEVRPRLALFLASHANAGFVGIRRFNCVDDCVEVLGDSVAVAPARAWLARHHAAQTTQPGTTRTIEGIDYLIVVSVLRFADGRPLGELVAGVNATTVVAQARDTAWLLVALTTSLLLMAIWLAQRTLAASVASRVRTLIGRLEGDRAVATDATSPATTGDELGVLSRRVQAHIERSLERERESDRRFQRLVDASPDAILVTADGRIIYLNTAAAQLLGAGASSHVIGRPLSEYLRTNGDGGEGSTALREGRLHRLDGGWTEVEVATVSFTYANEHAIQTTVRDISARKRAELAQRRTEEVYRALVEGAPYGMYRTDPALHFVTVNHALVRMLGYPSAGAVLATDTSSGSLFTDPARRQALVTRLQRGEDVHDEEVEWVRRDGTHITVRLNGHAVRDESGALAGFEMTVEDMTERRALEAQLRQAQKMEAVGQLTGGVAHDFNNLLTVILTNAELVVEALPPESETARADLGELRQAARRGAALVHKLLAFSRSDRLERREIRVGALLSDTAYMLRRVLPENISVKLPAEVPSEPILADPVAIEQILLNLATNARDAMPHGGRLELSASTIDVDAAHAVRHDGVEPGPFLRLSVRDSGYGMDDSTRARIFEPFFTTKPVGAGTGLGMAMVFGLVRHHQGFIEVESSIGQGTGVHIHLPVATAAVPVAPVPPAAPVEAQAQGGTILVVEDEEPIRRATTRVLQRMGYQVLLAGDGLEGLELARAGRGTIDLVISDLMMPRMGGKAFFDALRAEGDTTPFLFISGYTQESQEVFRGLGETASYLNKPWELHELLGRIRRLLGQPASGDG